MSRQPALCGRPGELMRKKIKKILIVVLICAAAAAIAAAVYVNSKVTEVSLSKKVVKALSSASSLASTDTIDFAGRADQSGVSFDVALKAVDENQVSRQPSSVYSERTVDITLMDRSTTQKNYIYVDGDAGTMYASTDGSSWYSQAASGEAYSIRTQSMQALFEAVADETQSAVLDEETAQYGDEDVYVLTADVSGGLLKDVMTGMLTSIEGEDSNRYSSVDWDGVKASVKALIYKDSKLPAQITVDCPDLGSQIMSSSIGGADTTSLTCSKFTVQIDLNGYNETSVTIPADIKDNAAALIGGTDVSASTETASTETAPEQEPEQ